MSAAVDDISHSRDLAFNLTRREIDVIRLVVEGYLNAEISRRLKIAENTVKHHLSSIYDKTGVSNRVELAVFAIHHRLMDTSDTAERARLERAKIEQARNALMARITGDILELLAREKVSVADAQRILLRAAKTIGDRPVLAPTHLAPTHATAEITHIETKDAHQPQNERNNHNGVEQALQERRNAGHHVDHHGNDQN